MPWRDALLIRPRTGTNGTKRLNRDLRTTDKLGVGRPTASPGTVQLSPPVPLNIGPTSQPQGEGRAEVAAASD